MGQHSGLGWHPELRAAKAGGASVSERRRTQSRGPKGIERLMTLLPGRRHSWPWELAPFLALGGTGRQPNFRLLGRARARATFLVVSTPEGYPPA